MKYTILNLGTLKVNAFEMIMGVEKEKIRAQYDVDSKDQIRIGMQALLLEIGNRIIVFDPGTATFLSKALADIYQLEMDRTIQEEIENAGYKVEDITDVIFTHLHFDHGSGAFRRVPGAMLKTFPNANYIVSREHFESIRNLSKEEQNSFFHNLFRFTDSLVFLEDWKQDGIEFLVSHGHTPHMMLPLIDAGDHDILYATDLIPMKLHHEVGAWSYYDNDMALINRERKKILGSMREGTEIIYFHEMR